MKRILHDAAYSKRILQMTADTMLLIDAEGVCQDITVHSDLWFLQEDRLIGKNIFEILPKHTSEKVYPEFKRVLENKISISKNFKLPLKQETFYFKCIMYPLDDMVVCQYRDITKRCNIKLELEKANLKLKEIQKLALIGIWEYQKANNTIVYYGYTKILSTEKVQQIDLDEYFKIVLEEDRIELHKWLFMNKEAAKASSFEYRVFNNGEINYIKAQILNIELDNNEEICSIKGYTQNITDLKKQKNDINILTKAINNANEDIFAAKEDGSLIFTNRKFREHHKISESSDLTNIKIDHLPQGIIDKEKWEKTFACTTIGTSKNFITYNPFPKNDKILAFEETVYCVINDAGEKSIWVFGHDISERIKHESEIKRLNMIMDITMKALPASIVVKDVNNNFKYIYRNKETNYKTIKDFRSAEGKTDFDYHPFNIAREKRVVDIDLAKNKKNVHDTIERIDENGNPIILDRRKVLVESKDFSPIIINIEWDITQQEIMKREILASKEKAEISDKLKSAFLANMSHEIRTPLNAIVGFSRIIADCDNAQDRIEYYNIVDTNNERLLKLIDEILDLSRIESGIVEFTLDKFKLHTLCREIYDAHVFRCPKGVKLIFDESDVKLEITSDKNRIFQVFSNLIGNAFKFIKEGSINYGYKKEGKYVVFHVTDTGIGISADKIEKVFDRFVKVNNFAQGTGLGLAICKTIIERLGGTISVQSAIGQGSTFTFSLPCQGIIAEEREKERTNMQEKMNNPGEYAAVPTILIAEDTDSNYDLLKAILGKTYNILRAKDGIEAIQIYDETKPDLILMDIKMPNMDGLSATKEIRKQSNRIPIIALSAYAYAYDREAAKEAGCNEFLTKPLSQTQLKETLTKWLNS